MIVKKAELDFCANFFRRIFPKFSPYDHFISAGNDSKIILYKQGFSSRINHPPIASSNPPKEYQQKKKKKQKIKQEKKLKPEKSTVITTTHHYAKINWLESSLTHVFVADPSN